MQKKCAHNTPLPFLCVMIKTYETARSHSLPLSKKGYWHLKSSMGGIYIYMYICVYIYIKYAQPPTPKQKTKKTKKKTKKTKQKKTQRTEPWGLQDLQWVWFLFFFVFLFLFGFLQGALPKESPHIFCWFNDFFNSLLGILPKEYQNIVVFLFV